MANNHYQTVIQTKRARLQQFLEAAESIQREAAKATPEEVAAKLEELKQMAYEKYYAQVKTRLESEE